MKLLCCFCLYFRTSLLCIRCYCQFWTALPDLGTIGSPGVSLSLTRIMQKPPNPHFLAIVAQASLDEKKQMLSMLSTEIAKSEYLSQNSTSKQMPNPNIATANTSADAPAVTSSTPAGSLGSLATFVEHIPDLGIDQALENGILDELSSLRLTGDTKSNKVKTQWLSPTSDSYKYSGVCNDPMPISKFTNICKLMGIVNSHPSTTGDADSCLVSCFTSSTQSLKLHKDNESLMAQSSSISTVSFGAPRKLQFVRDGKVNKKGNRDLSADIELDATNLTMNIMKAGAQQVMKHRVPAGAPVPNKPDLRYSLSFRRIVTQPNSSTIASQKATPDVSTPSQTTNDKGLPRKQPAVLVAGDSFAARLDADRLGKGKMKEINIAHGGFKITDVQKKIEKFMETNTQFDIEKVILSVGTNDIRYCKSGIQHLKNSICDFMKFVKVAFPSAKIFLQSIIPLAHNNCPYVTSNVLKMNNLLYNLCSRFHLFYLDVFGSFLNRWGYRNSYLFPEFDSAKQLFDIHPNKRGMGVLAKHYIYLIHSRWFNPLGY